MGVDTVKLVYDVSNIGGSSILRDSVRFKLRDWECVPGKQLVTADRFEWERRHYGTLGPVWWASYRHLDGTDVTLKGCGKETFLIWEQSVPKYLGICGPSEPDDVRQVDMHLRRLVPTLLKPTLRRVDVTADFYDPEGKLRVAAIGWKPHARARYVQAVYQENETVWLHNKTRGVRVYDNYAEKQQMWAFGQTRVEYQIRGAWAEKLDLDELHPEFASCCDRALAPVTAGLLARVQ